MMWGRRKRALRFHRDMVMAIKNAAKEKFGYVPNPALVHPKSFGKKSLGFFMPPMMEQVFGYGGNLRFVEFSFCPYDGQIGYSDGGDELRTDRALWMEFVNHPLVTRDLGEERYPTLYGKRLESSKAKHDGSTFDSLVTDPVGQWHCLMFDREERRVYLFKRIELAVFFPLIEPQERDDHIVLADGRLVSPGCEETKGNVSIDAIEGFVRWLDMAWNIRRHVEGKKWRGAAGL
jgi:hypothetical protein